MQGVIFLIKSDLFVMCSTCRVQGQVRVAHLCAMPQGNSAVVLFGAWVSLCDVPKVTHVVAIGVPPSLAKGGDRLGGYVFESNNTVCR